MMADVVYPKVSWPHYSVDNVRKMAGKDNQTKKGDTLGKDEFLKLMIAQMKNQDPTAPMDNKDLATQTAQFTSVEQLTNISEQIAALTQSLGNSSSLIGKQVVWNGETKTGNYDVRTGKAEVIIQNESGIVDSIVIRQGVHYVKIGSKELEMDKIVQIQSAPDKKDEEQTEVTEANPS